MQPHERAQVLVRVLRETGVTDSEILFHVGQFAVDAIRRAVAEERSACALIAEDVDADELSETAARIRARGEGPDDGGAFFRRV